MPLRLLFRLGLKFRDPAMEKADREFKIKVEQKLFFFFSVIVCMAMIAQVITNFVLGFGFVLIDFLLASAAIGAILIRNKIVILYKIFYTLFLPALCYQLITETINAVKPNPNTYNFVMGNFVGIMETLFLFSFKTVFLRISVACLLFIVKGTTLMDTLRYDNSTLWSCILFVVLITIQLYHDKVERENFKIIYESKQTLEKFHSLLSNDFPSNVAITNIEFTSILYSNQAFNEKFSSDHQQQPLQALCKNFLIDSILQPEMCVNYVIKGENLLDFVKRLSTCTKGKLLEEVIILSATYNVDENTTQHFEIRLRKILWESKTCYTIILNDLSDKQLVTALRYADEQKDRVIATVSHELRTPINGILGLLEMADLHVADMEVKTYLQHCKSCSKLLLYLVNSILDLSQIREKKLHIVKNFFSLDELLEEMESLYRFQCQQKNISLVIKKGLLVPENIYTDKFRLIEILINLLSNAFKFTFKGSITLAVSSDNENGKKLRFSVEDTGLGIKDEDKPKLFQMFGKIQQQNKNVNSHGAGLGLTIADSLVRALNDNDEEEKIEVASEFNKGSTFSFRINHKNPPEEVLVAIPNQDNESGLFSEDVLEEILNGEGRIQTKMETMSNRSYSPMLFSPSQLRDRGYSGQSLLTKYMVIPSPKQQRQQQGRVLVVDDNPFNLLTASFLLEKEGVIVQKAISGENCIDLLQKSCEENSHYNLILMDIQMPIQDGIETSRIINSKIQAGELYDVPIVALTANKVKDNELKEYKDSGMKEALEKPLKADTLNRILTTYIPSNEQI